MTDVWSPARLRAALRTGEVRAFPLSAQDYSYFRLLLAKSPAEYVQVMYKSRLAYIRKHPDGTYDLFYEAL